MSDLKRAVGGFLFVYAIVYAAQVLFNRFYADALDPQEIWDVFNYITGAGILIAIAIAIGNWRMIADADLIRRLTSQAGLYVCLALAIIIFFPPGSPSLWATRSPTLRTSAGSWSPS